MARVWTESFCSEVTENWLENQKPIGGAGVIVEIDETLIVRRKYNCGGGGGVWECGCLAGSKSDKNNFIMPP